MIKQIRQCTNPSELYDIMGDISVNLSSNKLTEIAEHARARQTEQNKYDKNNPYPYK